MGSLRRQADPDGADKKDQTPSVVYKRDSLRDLRPEDPRLLLKQLANGTPPPASGEEQEVADLLYPIEFLCKRHGLADPGLHGEDSLLERVLKLEAFILKVLFYEGLKVEACEDPYSEGW